MVEGRADNIKVTRPEDLSWPGSIYSNNVRAGRHDPIHPRGAGMIRTGHGFDETDFRVLRRAQA
jgi:hypothetical protein